MTITVTVIYNDKSIILVNKKEQVRKLSKDFKFKISEYITRRYKVYYLYPRYYLSCKFREIV